MNFPAQSVSTGPSSPVVELQQIVEKPLPEYSPNLELLKSVIGSHADLLAKKQHLQKVKKNNQQLIQSI